MTHASGRFASALPVSATLPDAARRIVAGLLGSPPRSVEMLRQGLMTFKVRVVTPQGEHVIVRFYPPGRADVVQREPDLLARCHAAGLPVPRVIGDSRTGPPCELAYVAYPMIEGETLSSRLPSCTAQQVVDLARDLIRHLRRLASLSFEGAGEVVTGRMAQDTDWPAFVLQSMRAGLDAARQHGLLDPGRIASVERILDRGVPSLAPRAHRLVWGDINFDNILVDPQGRIAGLIDFESCLSGDPLATLGYCFAAQGHGTLLAAVLDRWPGLSGAESRDAVWFYALLRALRLARYAHLPLPTGYARDPLEQIFPGMALALDALGRHTSHPRERS